MKDGILKETKNSRLLKADLPATYAELVALAANAGIPADVLFNAEGWQQLPTFLNKKNLLQDSTAGLLGLTGDPTVDDAFIAILLNSNNKAAVRVTVTASGKPAVAGIEIVGLSGLSGEAVYTDDNGTAIGFVSAGPVSISTREYLDLAASSAFEQEVSTGDILDVTFEIEVPQGTQDKAITTSGDVRFSPYIDEIDVCCIGGGGGGGVGSPSDNSRGGGGGGGYVTNSFKLKPEINTPYTAVIGAGGLGGAGSTSTAGKQGGSTSFMNVTASGGYGGGVGSGGSGNGSGGAPGNPGNDGTVRAFNDVDGNLPGGGGGGCSTYIGTSAIQSGGQLYGGTGGYGNYGNYGWLGGGGTGPGGGGGGGRHGTETNGYGGNGYRGEVRVRMRAIA